MTPVLPSDLATCPDCQGPVVLCGYWDEATQHAREILVTPEFSATYEFIGRDYAGRLVIRDKEKATKASHDWVCPAKPAPPVAPAEEDDRERPYQGPRSKNG